MIREKEPQRPSTRLSTLAAAELTAIAKHHRAEPPKLISLIRGDLDWIVMKCLEKDRTRRYETANGLAHDIQRHLKSEAVMARSPSLAYKAQKFVRRHRVGVSVGAALALTVLLGTAVSLWQAVRANRQAALAKQAEQQARREAEKSRQARDVFGEVFLSVCGATGTNSRKVIGTLIDESTERLDLQRFQAQPEVEAFVRTMLGSAYLAVGESAKAEAMHRTALELRRKVLGDTSGR